MPFIQGIVTSCEPIKGKDKLKVITINVGDEEDLTIVTNDNSIKLESKTVVATIGTEVEVEGELITIKKTSIGGVMSSGMICDTAMLKWSGGITGQRVNLQSYQEFKIGSPAPSEKSRGMITNEPQDQAPELSAKELKALEKEKRKAELAKKKADRKAKKDTTSGGDNDKNDKNDDNEDNEDNVEKVSNDLANADIKDEDV